MAEGIGWGKRASYIRTRHGVETKWADEAVGDTGAAWLDPDPTLATDASTTSNRKDGPMSRVDDIIATESDELERAELPDPLPARVCVERRNETRSRMFSVRLRADELVELEQAAQQRDLPARTLARTWLLDGLHAEQHSSEDLAARVERLEHAVFPDRGPGL